MRKEAFDVYIGRLKETDEHFGNPFSIGDSKVTGKRVENREQAIRYCLDWLTGKDHHEVEPARRQWVVNNLEKLRGKRLGCFCKPRACHGDIYRVMLGEIDIADIFSPEEQEPSHQGSLF